MAAHRYWRAIGLESYSAADLEITEFHLLAVSTRVDASATLTSNVAPTSGSLAALQDDDTSTGATWAGSAAKGLVLSWDFGGAGSADVTDIRIGSATAAVKFLLIACLQYSDDEMAWTPLTPFAGISWPGPRTKTSSASGTIVRNTVRGRSTPPATITIPTGASVVITHTTGKVHNPLRGRRDHILTDPWAQGIGRISGTVKEDGSPDLPVYRKVRLIRERDGILIREMWSDRVTGAYSFDYVDEFQKYTVLSYDYEHDNRAVVADNLTPDIIV